MDWKNSNYSLFISFYLLVLIFITSQVECQTAEYTICQELVNQKNKGNIERLNDLVTKLQNIYHEPCVIELIPLYYWAQNMSHIIVKFEFVNSAETSACDQILSIKKAINYDTFSLTLICLQSTFVIRYSISVKTFMPMNYYHAVWKNASQNSIILQCMKSPNPFFWKNLYLQKQVPLKKPKIWWKIMEKYKKYMKDFYHDLEVEEGEDNISGYVHRKKQIKLPKGSAHLNPTSQIYFYCNQNNPFELGSWLS